MKRLSAGFCCLMFAVLAARAGETDLLLRAARKAPDDLATLRAAGLPVVMETNPCLLLRGGTDTLQALRDRHYAVTILDRNADSSDFVVVGLTELSDDSTPVPLVAQMVSSVNTTVIDQAWIDLTTNPPTGTRYYTNAGCTDAANYCYNKFVSYGVPVLYQTWSAGNAPNVIGTIEGAVNPASVFIVVGHLDDLPASGTAPGANDNATGTINVLESARVMSCYAFRNTVKFLNVTGEEQGLYGSDAYAADALSRGENILGVINMDMIGWQGDGIPAQENLDLNYNEPSTDLGVRFALAATTYGTGLAVDAFLCPSLSASDHYPFWTRGYKAVCGITDN